ncbi:dTMP kinase [Mycolicibacterium sp. XJ775]
MAILVAIEGLDGAGKNTLTRAVTAQLERDGLRVAAMAFPRYGTQYADLAASALHGGLGDLVDSVYGMGLLFAFDRQSATPEIETLLAENDVVLLDRYAASSAAYSAARLDQSADGEVTAWVARQEFEVFGIPRPDLQVYLRVPTAVAAERAADREAADAARYHDGALAEYVRAPHWLIDPLPDNVSFEVGAKVNHLATAARALSCARIAPGATIVVTAATGSIGAATVLLASTFGVARLILVGRNAPALHAVSILSGGVATGLVATDDLPTDWATTGALAAAVAKLVPVGADAIIDYTPTGATGEQCLTALSTGGVFVHLGSNSAPATWSLSILMMNCWTVTGMRGATRSDSDRVLAMLGSGAVNADALITHRYPLRDTAGAFAAQEARGGGAPMWMVVAQP